ncbi:hypothetical protein V0U79_08875 [Hyphobacterium sp. HN65]|uniref:Lipoprotein n=1 Tax=Hyphobacterium lacteum TaxID=3116575 RepID=A0ABU7LSB7_9PROT|nr:hypothetical protein [Hyphobacterium sp. HN65]MEE2526479.1 hypothetical protein [Hyphobacterium sp. HN65]
MKKLVAIFCLASLAACSSPESGDETAAVAETEAPAQTMSLNETSWTFVMDGTEIFESIDADGNYIANAGDQHFDHGTYALVDGMHCFTSAMNDEGQICWTTPADIGIGESVDITSEQGAELTVTRVEYQPLDM